MRTIAGMTKALRPLVPYLWYPLFAGAAVAAFASMRAVGTSLALAAYLPVVAIGGITLERAAAVIESGAASVAVIGDLFATGDPEGRVRAYLQRLSRL